MALSIIRTEWDCIDLFTTGVCTGVDNRMKGRKESTMDYFQMAQFDRSFYRREENDCIREILSISKTIKIFLFDF